MSLESTPEAPRSPQFGGLLGSALSPWHHYVTLHVRNNGWTQSWITVLVYSRTRFGAKIEDQRDHAGYSAISVDGFPVIPSPNASDHGLSPVTQEPQ